ncbi:MAG TPA: oligosaccharide flippase family protein [Anaerolineae bacterium]|nr:oligosaccharide flippase family protein [Anaerolineae bacterium]
MLGKVASLSRQSAVYGLGTFLNQGIAFFLIPLYTTFLAPAEYGINGSVTAVMGVLAILLALSLESAVARFYYDYHTNEQRERYFFTAWAFLTLFGLLVAVMLDLAGDWLFQLAFRDVPFRPYGRLALWGSYLGVASAIPNVMFRVREQPRTFVSFSVSQFLLRVGLNILFVVHFRRGVAGIFEATLIVNAIYAVPYTWIAWRGMRPALDRPSLRASIAYALPFVPHRLSNWVLNVSDRIVLENLVPLDALGLYTVGYRFGLTLAALLDAVNLAWMPFYYKTAQEEGGRESLARLVTYYVYALLFVTLGTVLLSREVVYLMAAPRYHPSAAVVPPVAMAYGLHGLYLVMVSGPSYVKRTAKIPLYTGVAALVNIAINVLLIPRYGMMVAAWSTLAAFLVRALLITGFSLSVYPLPYDWRRMALAGLIGTGLGLGWFVDTGSWWGNLGTKTALLALFPLATWMLLLTAREKAGARALLRRFHVRLRSVGRG